MHKILLCFFTVVFFQTHAKTQTLAIADSLYATGEYFRAIKNLKDIHPKSEAVYLQLARNYWAGNNFAEAKKNYKIVLKKNPKRLITAVKYGNLLLNTHDLHTADSLFTRLAGNYPKSANLQYALGKVKAAENDSTFLKYYYKTIYLNPTHQGALYEIARYQLQRGFSPAAKKFALIGLEANPNNVKLLSILAQSYFHREEYKKAATEFKKLINLGQKNEFIYSSLGMTNYYLKQYKEAIKSFNLALAFQQNAQNHYMLGILYNRIEKFKKAELHLKKAIFLKNPALDAEYLALAKIYKQKEKYKKALKFLKMALKENPDNERAMYERAIAADNYYADLQTRMSYYQIYVKKYELSGDATLLKLAKNRISDIKRAMHQKRDK